MKKKTAIIVLVVLVIGAILLGVLFVNKGDGPVMGMMLADTALDDMEDYNDVAQTQGDGVYLIISSAFNKYQEDYKADISEGNDLFAAVHFVECPQGAKFIGRWIREGMVILEETKATQTGPESVISYMLAGDDVTKGEYIFELYDEDDVIFEKTFIVD